MTPTKLKLRPYQTDTIRRVIADWDAGHTDVLVTMATGGGKTIVFLEILDRVLDSPGKRALILAHRQELIHQPVERLYQFWPHRHGQAGIVMAESDEAHAPIVVATVQTLNSGDRLESLLAYGAIDYIISDECHHIVADSYLAVLEKLRDANPELRHLGVTATPFRSDEVGLGNVFEKESARYGIRELVQLGWLCPPRWLAVQTGISLKGVRSYAGSDGRDYSLKQLANVFETDNCFELVAESHRKYADGRKALAFTPSVDGAYRLAEKFREAGIPAAAADGTTAKSERAQILRSLRKGDLHVAVNCGIWTEGVDIPEVSCIHMVRPTQSDGLYVQCVGRGLRPVPGKEDALILDYAPKEVRNVVMLGDVLAGRESEEQADINPDVFLVDPEAGEGELVGGFTFDMSGFKLLTGDPAELISRALNYMAATPWRWSRDSSGWLFIGLGKGSDDVDRTVAMSPADETMSLYLVARKPEERSYRAYPWKEGSFEELTLEAERYFERRGNPILAQKQQRWRKEPSTDKQERFAKRLGCWKRGMSRGECAEAITATLALEALGKRGYLNGQ